MLGNRGRDTSPEIAVRRLLHRAGLRYRVDIRPERSVRRKADIVFTRQKIAVFIDGCFWHGCPDDFAMPKTNREYWEGKIGGNQLRDRATTTILEDLGWTVLRFWSHEHPAIVAEAIERQVRSCSQTKVHDYDMD